MDVTGGSSRRALYLSVLKTLVVAAVAVLAALVVVLVAHASTSSSLLLKPAEFLTIAVTMLACASLVTGMAYAWVAYPQHRGTTAAITLLTAAVLIAHLYVVNDPPVAQQAAVVANVGTATGDQYVSLNSTLMGQTLSVSAFVNGSNAVAQVNVSAIGGGTLVGPGFASSVSYASPAVPGTSVQADYSVEGQVSQVNVTLHYLVCYSASSKVYGCIMDEVYYVPEAMGMLAGIHCSTNLPNCHMEHPPLSPLLVAAGMAIFGVYNAFGWRLMPMLLGTFSVPLLFGIAWKVSRNKKIALLSALLLALDVMFFAQSGAALLDIPMAFFGLAATLVYVMGWRLWVLDRYVLAGILLGAAGLSKETAVFMAAGLLTYNFFLGAEPPAVETGDSPSLVAAESGSQPSSSDMTPDWKVPGADLYGPGASGGLSLWDASGAAQNLSALGAQTVTRPEQAWEMQGPADGIVPASLPASQASTPFSVALDGGWPAAAPGLSGPAPDSSPVGRPEKHEYPRTRHAKTASPWWSDSGKYGRFVTTAKMAFVMALVFCAGLQAYDSTLATPGVPNFLDQIHYILSYGSSLIANQLNCKTTGYWCQWPTGTAPIIPPDWILYYTPVTYYGTSVSVCPDSVKGACLSGQYSYVSVAYYGTTNFFETWTVFIWVPLVAYLLYRARRKPQGSLDAFVSQGAAKGPDLDPELRFGALALTWFAWNFIPYLFLFAGGRVTYPFYFIPAIPGVAMGASFLLTRKSIPRWLVAVYMVAVFIFFFLYFPVKDFLPVWIRVALGH